MGRPPSVGEYPSQLKRSWPHADRWLEIFIMIAKARTSRSWSSANTALGSMLGVLGLRPGLASRDRRLCPEGLADDRGLTLVELLVVTAISIMVLGAVLTLLDTSQQIQARDAEWTLTMQEGRAGLARMAHEIRQASKVETAEGGKIVFLATIGSKAWEIEYECGVAQSGTTYHQCVRYAAEQGKSLPASGTPTVSEVLNPTTVFSYSPSTTSPNLVTLKVELPAKGTLKQPGNSFYNNHIVLENAAFMRNLDLAG
jgi:competence protein ComGC